MNPIGGHGIFIDAKKFLPHLKQIQFPAQALAAEIYEDSGVRTMERSIVSAGRNSKTGDHYYPELELGTTNYSAPCVYTSPYGCYCQIYRKCICKRDKIKGLEMIYEPAYLRFFQAKFKKL